MRKWLRRTFIAVGAILVIALLLSVSGLMLFRSAPAWYGGAAPSAAEREQAASAAENKLIRAQNWAQELRADEVRLARATERGATRPATRASDSMTLSLTQHEINALVDKWSVLYGWKRQYSEYLENPQVILRDGVLILAGRVKNLNSVLSFQFQPQVDAQGQLQLDLVRVTGGKLPLPDAFWTPWRDKMLSQVSREMPRWRGQARIESTGAANVPAMAATMGELFQHVARRESAQAVLFLPLVDRGNSVPVKVKDVRIEQDRLTLDVQPLTTSERSALLDRIRSSN